MTNNSLIHSIETIKAACPGFNVLEHNAEVFWSLIETEDIYVDFWNLQDGVNGFYGINRLPKKPVKWIVLDNRLTIDEKWLIHGLHEMVHHYLDAPASTQQVYFSKSHAKKSREETRADKLALIFRYPKRLAWELAETPADQLIGYNLNELKKRIKILEDIGE